MPISRWPILLIAAVPLVFTSLERGPAPGLSWWTTHSLEKIRPYDREPKGASQNVKISAARNEFEPFQVVLRADGEDIDAVDIEITDLQGKSAVIPSEKYILAYLERYLDLKKPSSVAGGSGEWPDPLVPRVDRYANEKRNAFPFKLISGRNQPIWIDVYVPPSIPAGLYSGQVRVLVAGKPQLSIPMDLEVWNFQLPSTSSLITTFAFSGNSAVRGHYGKYTSNKDVDDLTFIYAKAALWHRITLDGSPAVEPSIAISNGHVRLSWNEYDKVNQPFMDGGVFSAGQPLYGARATSAALTIPAALKTPEQQIEFWREVAAHFREKGWFDRLFNYVWDEPAPKDFPAVVERGRIARRADPALKNLVASPLIPDWSDFIDIWTPVVNCFERKAGQRDFCHATIERAEYDPELAKGKKLWWYQACGSHGCNIVGGDYFRGWPSYMIDDAPIRNRIMEWITWKYGIGGELYYSTIEAYGQKPDPWRDVYLFGGNGDGTLFYPGRPDVIGGRTDIPIESIRLKLIREGLEDYEYLKLLSKLGSNKEVADALNGFIRHIYDYDQDPEKLYSLRESLGQEIRSRSGNR